MNIHLKYIKQFLFTHFNKVTEDPIKKCCLRRYNIKNIKEMSNEVEC